MLRQARTPTQSLLPRKAARRASSRNNAMNRRHEQRRRRDERWRALVSTDWRAGPGSGEDVRLIVDGSPEVGLPIRLHTSPHHVKCHQIVDLTARLHRVQRVDQSGPVVRVLWEGRWLGAIMLVVSRLSVTRSGHLGAVRAPCLADLGHEVVGIDVPPGKAGPLSNGLPPFQGQCFRGVLVDAVVDVWASGHRRRYLGNCNAHHGPVGELFSTPHENHHV